MQATISPKQQKELVKKLNTMDKAAQETALRRMFDWFCGYEAGYSDKRRKPKREKSA